MATDNFFIAPEDGWVQVAAAVDFIRVSSFPRRHSFFITTTDSGAPSADEIGVLIDEGKYFWCNVPIAGEVYVRTSKPTPDKNVRIDVFSIETTP